jgi:hypothetical protein
MGIGMPKLSIEETSVYVSREGYRPLDPPWKSMPFVKDIFEEEPRSRDA